MSSFRKRFLITSFIAIDYQSIVNAIEAYFAQVWVCQIQIEMLRPVRSISYSGGKPEMSINDAQVGVHQVFNNGLPLFEHLDRRIGRYLAGGEV